ncbi:hypothetical protein BMS3Abin07_00608 [bacterium BMS3Abin07]|nr:hypothetical protein BMS3Abin07_00608 [bacterium BMS3Abin07]GBE31274.1 hypothetical protein BMS3Bbin05_00173 [bacterium BMS3Bbin05]
MSSPNKIADMLKKTFDTVILVPFIITVFMSCVSIVHSDKEVLINGDGTYIIAINVCSAKNNSVTFKLDNIVPVRMLSCAQVPIYLPHKTTDSETSNPPYIPPIFRPPATV